MNKRIHIIMLGIFALVLTACDQPAPPADTAQALSVNSAFVNTIVTTKAVQRKRNEELTLTAKVGYNPDRLMTYVPLVSGVVSQTYFSLGDKVSKGQTLLDIRSAELTGLQAELLASEYDIKIAERELQSIQSMYDDNLLSAKDLLEAQSTLRQSEMRNRKIQSDMSVYGHSNGNGTFAVLAPMSGYVVGKSATTGSTLSADGEPLFIIADLSTVWVTANVYANNLLYVKEGMKVSISTSSYGDQEFVGQISNLSQVFDPEEKVLKARIVMNNKDMRFKPEMSVTVRLLDELHATSISIPTLALIFDHNTHHVVVKHPDATYHIQAVVLDGHYGNDSYIASGLNVGDEVVVKNQLLMYEALSQTLESDSIK